MEITKITEDDKQSQFLKWIYADNIPDDLEKEVLPCGTIIYTEGKPNIRGLILATIRIMNS